LSRNYDIFHSFNVFFWALLLVFICFVPFEHHNILYLVLSFQPKCEDNPSQKNQCIHLLFSFFHWFLLINDVCQSNCLWRYFSNVIHTYIHTRIYMWWQIPKFFCNFYAFNWILQIYIIALFFFLNQNNEKLEIV
jgi:hypothetical protein